MSTHARGASPGSGSPVNLPRRAWRLRGGGTLKPSVRRTRCTCLRLTLQPSRRNRATIPRKPNRGGPPTTRRCVPPILTGARSVAAPGRDTSPARAQRSGRPLTLNTGHLQQRKWPTAACAPGSPFFALIAYSTRFFSGESASIFLSSLFSRSTSLSRLAEVHHPKLALPAVERDVRDVPVPADLDDALAAVRVSQNADLFFGRVSIAFHFWGSSLIIETYTTGGSIPGGHLTRYAGKPCLLCVWLGREKEVSESS